LTTITGIAETAIEARREPQKGHAVLGFGVRLRAMLRWWVGRRAEINKCPSGLYIPKEGDEAKGH
jgi:hypothetical protein